MMKSILMVVVALGFSAAANAGVILSGECVPDHINSLGQEVYILTAMSDAGNITSVGIKIESNGNLQQVHPAGQTSPDMNSNNFFAFVGAEVDHDTQALFDTTPANVLVVGGTDTDSLLEINITGFEPAAVLPVVQIVMANETNHTDIWGVIGVVVDGVEYTIPIPIPEPASLTMLAVGAALAMRRR